MPCRLAGFINEKAGFREDRLFYINDLEICESLEVIPTTIFLISNNPQTCHPYEGRVTLVAHIERLIKAGLLGMEFLV